MKLTGRLYIDGADAFTEYGVFVEQYGYKGLVGMPAFKTISVTEWAEYDGEEADLTAPVLDAKTVSIPFCILNVRKAEDLYVALCDGAYHTFRFTDLGNKEYKLRMTSTGSFSSLICLGKLTIAFSDDFPPEQTGEPYAAGESGVKQTGYMIDGIDFAQFGVYVVRGTDDSLRKSAEVRAALSVSPTAAAGVIYDEGATPRFRAKDATLKLFIHGADIDDFWSKWNALFATVTAAEARTLYFPKLGAEYECYYKSCTVSKFEIVPAGRVWCEFNLVLRITAPTLSTTYWLLISEAEEYIVTETDGAAIMI